MADTNCNCCGTGGWTGPKPGDPDNNSILTATPAFGGIDVSWSFPVTNPYAVAHTLLYRGNSADFNSSILRAVVAGNFFYDKIDDSNEYFYWISIVSVHGTYGELIGPARARAKPTIEGMIELLTGQIDAGLLAQSLKGDLDKISLLNTNLLNEITARENGEITLAQAMEAVNEGVAEALTFIHTEINSRTTADSAIAEQLNLVAATLGDTIAAVSTSMSVTIDQVTNTVNAMWTAQVNVNGLIGGFGLANDGTTVEAGFDVDRFWIGRTSANKRKPFIIDSGVVYIDEAAINKLTFSKLRDESGSFIVEGGRVKADYLTVNEASIQNASISNAKIKDAAITNAKIGDAQITTAKIGDLQVDTAKIAGQAVTIPAGDSNGTNSISIPFNVPGTETISVFISGTTFIPATGANYGRISVDGADRWIGAGVAGSTVAGAVRVDLGPGAHTLRMYTDAIGAGVTSSIFALGVRR